MNLLRSYAADNDNACEEVLTLIAGSVCKDFSSMGTGARLVGQHASWLH